VQENVDRLSDIIVAEFQDHIEQILPLIERKADIETATRGCIAGRIGQIDNTDVWGALAHIYAEMLHEKLSQQS